MDNTHKVYRVQSWTWTFGQMMLLQRSNELVNPFRTTFHETNLFFSKFCCMVRFLSIRCFLEQKSRTLLVQCWEKKVFNNFWPRQYLYQKFQRFHVRGFQRLKSQKLPQYFRTEQFTLLKLLKYKHSYNVNQNDIDNFQWI